MDKKPIKCCDTCRKKVGGITGYEYSSDGGCLYFDYEGYACLARQKEGLIIHMLGTDPAKTVCEDYFSIEKRQYTYIKRKKKKRKYKKRKKNTETETKETKEE